MAVYCKCVFRKVFEDEVSKQAYLQACKWLAKNIYSNVELSKHIVVNIEKGGEQLPAFIVSVYVKEDADEIQGSFCRHCKMLHTLFYSIDGMKCSECKANALVKELDKQLKGKVVAVSDILEGKENGER